MRKILLILVALVGVCLHTSAQGMTATLQSGDSLSVFYGASAFSEAYIEAKDGDQITLSAGTFYAPYENITKSVKITGIGAFEDTGNTIINSLNVSAEDARIEGVRFTGTLYVSGSNNLIIKRSWIEELDASKEYKNALFDQSVLMEIKGMENVMGFTFKNCTIKRFQSTNKTTSIGNFLNCIIYEWGSHSKYSWESNISKQPYAIYKNCILGSYFSSSITVNPPSEFYYNVFCDDYYTDHIKFNDCINVNNSTVKKEGLYSKAVYPAQRMSVDLGDDNTVVGPYGGTGFSQYPAIPRILSQSIDGSTNDEGKINVKIEVKAEN